MSIWTAMKVKQLRTDLGLTQEQLALKLGVNQVTVSLYESGARNPGPATRDRLERLAQRAAKAKPRS